MFPEITRQHENPRILKQQEKSRLAGERWLANKNAQSKWADEFLTTKRGEQSGFVSRELTPESPQPEPLKATAHRGDSDLTRTPRFPAGSNYTRVNASPVQPERANVNMREILSVQCLGRVETFDARVKPGRKNPKQRTVSAKAKWLNKGRVDPSARFHGIEQTSATNVDCHKTKQPLIAGELLNLILERDRQMKP
jgi:hypothetical protein